MNEPILLLRIKYHVPSIFSLNDLRFFRSFCVDLNFAAAQICISRKLLRILCARFGFISSFQAKHMGNHRPTIPTHTRNAYEFWIGGAIAVEYAYRNTPNEIRTYDIRTARIFEISGENLIYPWRIRPRVI